MENIEVTKNAQRFYSLYRVATINQPEPTAKDYYVAGFLAGHGELLPLLRELAMRGNYAFPANELDLRWFNEGTKDSGNFIERLFITLGMQKETFICEICDQEYLISSKSEDIKKGNFCKDCTTAF